jgi:hypothetical protein
MPPTSVLVGIVGENPASVLVAARALQPTRVILLHSAVTAPVATALKHQLELGHAQVDLLECAATGSVQASRGAVASMAFSDRETVCLDLTGGPKTWSTGAWQGLRDRLGDALQAVVLDQSTQCLCDALSGAPLLDQPTILPEEFLAWRGASVQSCEWGGWLTGYQRTRDKEQASLRLQLCQALVSAVAAGRAFDHGQGGVLEVSDVALPSVLPCGFERHGAMLVQTGDGSDLLSHHRWLEAWVWLVLGSAFCSYGDVYGAYSLGSRMSRKETTEPDDQADVVLTRGPRLLVIEAKAGIHDLHTMLYLRAQKARSFYGSMTHVLLVAPGMKPARADSLRLILGRGASIVHSPDPAALVATVAGILGLPT